MIWSFIWLALLIGFLVVEASTVSMVSLWFAVGALGGILTSLLGGPVWLQVTVFFVLSLGCLLALRPLVRKYIQPKLVKTNVDSVVGKTGVVQEPIDNNVPSGSIKMDAMVWTARSLDGTPIPAGTLVRVEKIQGVKAIVTPVYAQVQ